MRYLLIIFLVFSIAKSFAQTKKQQIEILSKRVDSLNQVLNSERNINSEKINSLNEIISNQNNQVSNLEIQIGKLNSNTAGLKKELENKNKDLLSKSLEIKILENQINEKLDSIKLLRLKITNFNTKLELISPPSFFISEIELIKLVDTKMIDPCPEQNVLGETGSNICKKNVTRIQYFNKGGAIRFFADVGYSFDGARFDPGQDGFILAEYQNNKWVIVDFFQFQHDGCWGNSLQIEDQFVLGENALGFYAVSCVYVHGFTECSTYIIGFSDNKISVFLNELSSEDNLGSGEKPVINWKYNYKPTTFNNNSLSLERQLFEFDKMVSKERLIFNTELLKFE